MLPSRSMAAMCVVPSAGASAADARHGRACAPTHGAVLARGSPGGGASGAARSGADERRALARVRRRQQLGERDRGGVAVVPLAVGERELQRLRHHVDVARGVVAHRAQVDGGQHAERLHQHGPLRPRGLAEDLAPVERHAQRAARGACGSPRDRTRAAARRAARRSRRSSPRCRRDRSARARRRCPRRDGRAPRVGLDEPLQRAGERRLHEQLADARARGRRDRRRRGRPAGRASNWLRVSGIASMRCMYSYIGKPRSAYCTAGARTSRRSSSRTSRAASGTRRRRPAP